MVKLLSKGKRGPRGFGPFKYLRPEDNHVLWTGRGAALREFIGASYGGMKHKVRNAVSSNSEDALTWSCFDTLRQVNEPARSEALTDLWELAYGTRDIPSGVLSGEIFIGKTYGEAEKTEVDASIEGPSVLVFLEAKLYSPMSGADPGRGKLHNQLERKLRVGLREAAAEGKRFFFILLDIAPCEALRSMKPGASLEEAKGASATGFGGKWVTAYWFTRYKCGSHGSLSPLRDVLTQCGLPASSVKEVADAMGWLTWADVFKAVLRATLAHPPAAA